MPRFFAIVSLLLFLGGPAFAQGESEEARVCRAACAETCTAEVAQQGCNVAMGLTSCRVKQDRCVTVCQRKCPRR